MKHDEATVQPAPLGQVERGVVPLRPERFCAGVQSRDQCDDCEGRYVPAPGWSLPLRILAHQPWPFEPCPHYVAPV